MPSDDYHNTPPEGRADAQDDSVVSNVDLDINRFEQLKLLEDLSRLRKEHGLSFYRPHAKQDAFHRAGEFKHRMVRAGNRFGKSEMGCAEDVSWLLGVRPWYPESDLARKAGLPDRPVKGLIITTDWDKVDEVFTSQRGANPGKVWKYIPSGEIKSTRRNHSGAIDTIELNRGSVLRFDTVKSFMANPQGSESSDYDFIHVDEPCPKKMYDAAARGLLDRNGKDWFTLTPLSEFWINDMFFPDARAVKDNCCHSLDKRIWSITGAMADNPLLTEAAINDFITNLGEDERAARLFGVPLHLSGLVYKEFSYDKHVLKSLPKDWSSFENPPTNYTIYEAIDPHPRTPHAVLFLAVSPHGTMFVFDEIWCACTLGELGQRIKNKDGNRFIASRKIDPLAYIPDPITEDTMADALAREGIWVEKASKAREHGTLRVKEELLLNNNIYFSPNVSQTLWEISRYHWDEKDTRRENKPIDKDDHFMENLYRMLLDRPVFIDQDKPSDIPDELNIDDDRELNPNELDSDLTYL